MIGAIQLTAADDGGTFLVKVGQSVELSLSTDGLQWSPVHDNPPGLLAAEPAPAPPPHGQLVKWTARRAGAVNVTAVGTAYCAAGTACPMFARLFQVTLDIS